MLAVAGPGHGLRPPRPGDPGGPLLHRRCAARGLVRLTVWDLDWSAGHGDHPPGQGRQGPAGPAGRAGRAWVGTLLRSGAAASSSPGVIARVLFLTGRPGRSSPTASRDGCARYVEAAGIAKHGRCHLLRHTVATLMLEGGADIRYIQADAGPRRPVDHPDLHPRQHPGKLTEIHAATHPGARLKHDQALLDAMLEAEAVQGD